MDTAEAFDTQEREGVLAGPVRRPVNLSRADAGSIHDDATAQTLGFRGGTVAANIHCEQLPPLLMRRFGDDWRRTGGFSLYFLNATTDGEPVQAFAGPEMTAEGGLRRAPVWMETPEGVRVCEGTASLGDDMASALRARVATVRPPEALRMLARAEVGDEVADIVVRIDPVRALQRLEAITEPMPEYRDAAAWGERVAAPAVAIDALRAVEQPLFPVEGEFVGMFGAIELQHLDGPVFIDHDYRVSGRILALSESPKTEVAWYESTLREPDGRVVARMILMSRLLKASSPLWS